MDVNYRIAQAREQAKISQRELAERVGITQQAINYYENGQRDPKTSMILSIADALGVSVSYLLGIDDARWIEKKPVFVPVPLYGSVAAGIPIEMIPIEDMKEAPESYISDDHDAYLVRVCGDSMNRIIHDGSFALISPKYTEPNDRDVFLVTVNGDDATIKRVHVLANGIELIPDSYDPTYRPQIYDFGDEDTPPIRILGKVVWWCKSF